MLGKNSKSKKVKKLHCKEGFNKNNLRKIKYVTNMELN